MAWTKPANETAASIGQHSPLPWRLERVPRNGVLHIVAHGVSLETDYASGMPMYGEDSSNAEFIVRACNAHADLLAALKEMREACCAAMRVVADLDTAHLIGADAETRQQRFIDELRFVGVKDGFGKRADAVIAKAGHK